MEILLLFSNLLHIHHNMKMLCLSVHIACLNEKYDPIFSHKHISESLTYTEMYSLLTICLFTKLEFKRFHPDSIQDEQLNTWELNKQCFHIDLKTKIRLITDVFYYFQTWIYYMEFEIKWFYLILILYLKLAAFNINIVKF